MTLENVKVGDVVVVDYRVRNDSPPRYRLRKVTRRSQKYIWVNAAPFEARYSVDDSGISTDPALIAQVQADEDRKKAERADYEAQRAALKSTPHWQAADALKCLLRSDFTADEIMAKWSCVAIQDALRALGGAA